jgi:Stress responsive A/B Barrel Domain
MVRRFSETSPPMKSIFAALLLFTMSTIAADGLVYHVVHFKFKQDAKKEDVKKVETEFAALKEKIKEVDTLVWGTDISPEKLSDGFTHCWIVTFKNEKARDAYLVHPAHKAFVEVLKPVLEKPLVVDFVAQK